MTDYGYLRVCSAVPNVRPGNVDYNVEETGKLIQQAIDAEADLVVFPELGLTGYTCGDLFDQPLLLKAAADGLLRIAGMTDGTGLTAVVGLPVEAGGILYNCAAVVANGSVIGIVPKSHIPNYSEFYEKRWFASGAGIANRHVAIAEDSIVDYAVPFGTDLIFEIDGVKFGVEICEDLWVPVPPSCRMAQYGAEVIVNLSASDTLIGKYDYIRSLVSQQSARCRCAYVYSSAGWGESSTDLVFAGIAMTGENGKLTETEQRFFTEPTLVTCDVDIEKLRNDRRRNSTFHDGKVSPSPYRVVSTLIWKDNDNRSVPDIDVDPTPFVPKDASKLKEHCEEIINIQARGLMQRLHAIGCRNAVIGISGGLDSTLALLVTVRTFDLLGFDRKGITGITMPGMATTSRTRGNAWGLMEQLGVTALEIPIGEAVRRHFSDIGQDPERYDVTYENSQARERTQILMDYSNKVNGIVIGTGDMSELALGWCTYNGDHMSMYGVNASVPKTLVRHLVEWFATEFGGRTKEILLDIIDTPISPELVPSGSDTIAQKTEDLVGPYELHDFYMYHLLRNSFSPAKSLMLARLAFGRRYSDEELVKWLRNFYRRFFSQQFKRSCMPDGPKVGSVNLSPRGDWRMPSDASGALWQQSIDDAVKSL